MKIATLDELEREAQAIQDYVESNFSDIDNGNEAANRGDTLNVYIARTSKMMADAKYLQDCAITENITLVHESYKNMPPSTANKLAESMSQRENKLFTWISRLNAACTHQQQFCITIISKAKAEMYLNGKTGNVRNNSGGNTW
jgi:hypothetical protein